MHAVESENINDSVLNDEVSGVISQVEERPQLGLGCRAKRRNRNALTKHVDLVMEFSKSRGIILRNSNEGVLPGLGLGSTFLLARFLGQDGTSVSPGQVA